MRKIVLLIFVWTIAFGCKTIQHLPETIGSPQNAVNYGYQPIDPLPARVYYDTHTDKGKLPFIKGEVKNGAIMSSLPDETMRLAIGQVDSKGNVNFTAAKLGIAGSSYIVILDYIKFDTKTLQIKVAKDSNNNLIDFRTLEVNEKADAIIPTYVGIGLRFTASIQVNEGSVDLGNLFALGLAAESKKVTGTLIVQTLGISGKDISTLIPMPSQINTTTIQNSIMALASIKAKIYEDDIEINPRVVGFYNNIGGGQSTVYKFITSVLSQGVDHIIE